MINRLLQAISSSLKSATLVARRYGPIAVVILVVLSVAGTIYYLERKHEKEFNTLYDLYATAAQAQDDAIFLIGAQNNPIRQQLNVTLQEMLDSKTKDARRLDLAHQGLTLLDRSQEQIEAVSAAKEKADSVMAQMQILTLDSYGSNDIERKLIAQIKQRSGIVSDIRAYTLKANFEMTGIFTHIISDNGTLKSSYIIELNNEVPDVQIEFDKRTALYAQLKTIEQDISDAALKRK